MKLFDVRTSCGGGSPLLMFMLFWLYIPIGLVVTLVAVIVKAAIKAKESYDDLAV